jgi:hypothetical protein
VRASLHLRAEPRTLGLKTPGDDGGVPLALHRGGIRLLARFGLVGVHTAQRACALSRTLTVVPIRLLMVRGVTVCEAPGKLAILVCEARRE